MTAYQSQLDDKTRRLRALLAPFAAPEAKIFPSPPEGYRMRAEFRVWHDGDDCHFAMTGADGKPVRIDTFPPAHAAINRLMPRVITALHDRPALRHRLFQAEFQTTQAGETMLSLIYHRPLDDAWQEAAEALAAERGVHLIGRARREKRIIGQDYITETFRVGGRDYHYRQYENSFSQPNATVCQHMLDWATAQAGSRADLLELYCGNGNFTLPLSRRFRRVLATEVSKTSVQAAQWNIEANGADNIRIARLSAEEFTEAFNGSREFRRLQEQQIDLAEYGFSTVFVDPPRAGVDDDTLKLLARFDRIIYISCNPETLRANLDALLQTHTVERAALFDQFPFTGHIESGLLLHKKAV